jgi:ankyrin repeat protein
MASHASAHERRCVVDEALSRLLSSDEVGRTLSFAELERLRRVDRSLWYNEFWVLAWTARVKITGDPELRRTLRLAIEAGMATHVRLIVKDRPAVLRQDLDLRELECCLLVPHSHPYLQLALKQHDVNSEVVDALLEAAHAADVVRMQLMFMSVTGQSCLMVLASGRHPRYHVSKTLLTAAQAAGVLPTLLMLRDHDGNTCLAIASDKGHLDVVNALLEAARAAGVLPGLLMMINHEEESSLWIAAGKGRLEVVNALLEAARAADVLPELLYLHDRDRASCLSESAFHGRLEVTNALLEAARAAGVLRMLLLLPTLCLSVRKGHLAVVNALLEAAKSVHMLPELLLDTELVSTRRSYGSLAYGPYIHASSLWTGASEGHLEVVNALLEAARAARVLPAMLMLEKSYSSLRVSVESGHLDVVKRLLGAAKDAGVLSELLMLRDHRGDTCLSMADQIGRKDIAEALATAGAEF